MYFQEIWKIREDHMVKDLPVQYLFFLVCCGKLACVHPICQRQSREGGLSIPRWYNGGPDIHFLPFPIPDNNRRWGAPDCPDCKGECHGHYLKPEEAMKSSLQPMRKPPSAILKTAFAKLKGKRPSQEKIVELAKETLLSVHEVEIWFDHLETVARNRKRGAAKAAETRRRKKAKQKADSDTTEGTTCYCGICHEPYVEYTDEVQDWIQCDSCESWVHFVCAGLDPKQLPPSRYDCEHCSE